MYVMYVCLRVCLYGWTDGWMEGSSDLSEKRQSPRAGTFAWLRHSLQKTNESPWCLEAAFATICGARGAQTQNSWKGV